MKIKFSKKNIVIIILLLLVFALTVIIFKYNNYYDNRTYNELKNAIIMNENDKISKENNEKLIFITGHLDYNFEKLHDDLFDIYVETSKMMRWIETYQWVEYEETNKDGTKKYVYKKEWSSDIIDSNNFNNKEYKNPTKKYAENKLFIQKNIKIGEFNISESVYDEIQYKSILDLNTHMVLPEGFKKNGGYITNSIDPKNPEIGDTRVAYVYSNWFYVSILAKQNGNTVEKYTTKNNEKMITIINNKQDFDTILNDYNYYIIK